MYMCLGTHVWQSQCGGQKPPSGSVFFLSMNVSVFILFFNNHLKMCFQIGKAV